MVIEKNVIDFSENKRINEIIKTHQSYILFSSPHAKSVAIFLIDSTWSCSKKIFSKSNNLNKLKHLSFESSRESKYQIKEQPKSNYLSTIESTHVVLELLNFWHVENVREDDLNNFLNPFFEMIKYQKKLIENPLSNSVRFKKRVF